MPLAEPSSTRLCRAAFFATFQHCCLNEAIVGSSLFLLMGEISVLHQAIFAFAKRGHQAASFTPHIQ